MLLALALAGNVAWNCNFFATPFVGRSAIAMSRRGRLIGVGAGMEATHQIKFENFTLALGKRGERGEGSRENSGGLGQAEEREWMPLRPFLSYLAVLPPLLSPPLDSCPS